MSVILVAPAWFLGGVQGMVLALPAVILVWCVAALRGWVLPASGRFRGKLAEGNRDNALALRPALLDDIADSLGYADRLHTGVLVVLLDHPAQLARDLGDTVFEELIQRVGLRLRTALNGDGGMARLDGAAFGIVLAPAAGRDCDALVALARRLQDAAGAPLDANAITLRPSVSVGVCHERAAPDSGAAALLEAAQTAAEQALASGPSAVRKFRGASPGEPERLRVRDGEIQAALDSGAIHAVFQPQIIAATGAVAGIEALVRWRRDDEVMPPDMFLPALHRLGLSERLTRRMLAQALDALETLDGEGLVVPGVAINLAGEELRVHHLADTVVWELECRGIDPDRLVIEILESVVAGEHDIAMVRNIELLSRAGCGVDLDDFGTGHASIANIRRFAVGRLKIDRSFVCGVDRDEGQQRLVGAIVSMAQQLSLDVIAEGVEADAEAAMLQRLGCQVVQGYAFARPMPLEELRGWLVKRVAAPALAQGGRSAAVRNARGAAAPGQIAAVTDAGKGQG